MRFVVLGAGTEIGKTHVSCALLAAARARGLRVRAVKPVMSGFSRAALAQSDAGRLMQAAGESAHDAHLAGCVRYAFEPALAPNVAARAAGVAIDYDDILCFTRDAMAAPADFALVEGAGGVLSPINDERLNADLAADLGLPAILVTANYLGAVSHTLSAIEACAHRGVGVAALAVSQPTQDHGAPAALCEELARWTPIPCVGFGFAPEAASETGARAQRLLDVLGATVPPMS